ncbi:MAG: gliding motility-associated C-terminal domain-containing protein [Flavobacteriales bacterium]
MKKNLLLVIAFMSIFHFGHSQCSTVPIKEAVRNGDFEQGYLPGPAAKNHVSTPGSNLDFYCDMDFLGNYPTAPASHDIADHYAVMRAENFFFESTNFVNNTYWGVGYGGDANFKDHTTGIVHGGHALVVDLAFRTTSPKSGGLPIAWEQTVDIAPNQKYWFSAWIANYSAAPSVPIMQVTIIPYNASDGLVDNAGIQTLPITGSPAGVMQWTNMYSAWTPTGVYNKATIRFEFVNIAGGSTGLDVAIDDISFINTCQNVNGQNAYTANFQLSDTVNLCRNNGSITLDPNVVVGQQNNATIHWYSGAGNPQMEISTGNWSQAVTSAGSYRVCIDDPDNNCAVVDNVVVIDTLSIPLADLDLCSPSFYTLDAGFNIPNSAVSAITWNGPSGTSKVRTYDVINPGAHTVNVVSAAGLNCNFSGAFNVTSPLPNTQKNLQFRECADTTLILTMGDGKNYNWSKNQNLTPLLDTGTTYNLFIPNGTSGDQTIWYQSAEYTTLPNGGPTGASITAGYPAAGAPMAFTTTTATKLNSFVIATPSWANGCGDASTTVSVTFTITGPVTFTHTVPAVTCNDALITVTPVGWDLPDGSYTLTSSIPLRFCPALGSRTIGGGIVTITNPDNTNNNTWNRFADMSFSAIVACDPAPIKITALCCNKPADNPKVDPSSVLDVCKAADAKVVFSPLTIGYDYKFIVSHDNGATYKDTLSGTVGASGTVTLQPVSGSGKYKLIFATAGNINSNCAKLADDSAIAVIKNSPSKPVVTLNPNKTFCVGEAHTLTASSTVTSGAITYTWSLDASGNGATKNGLTTLGAHSYKVVATANGCSDSTTTNTSVIPLETADVLAAGPFCSGNSPYQLLLAGGSTLGGTWSGTGVNNTTGIFTPSGLSGTYKVLYTSSNTVCAGKDSIDIVVNPSASFNINSVKTSYCKNGSSDTIEVSATGGTFWTKSGKGITDSTNGYYNPQLADAGVDTIYYGVAGACGDTAQLAITVYDSTTVTFILADDEVCINTAAFPITVVSLPNGTFSGSGVTAGNFTPATAGVGKHTILYTYTDGNNCTSKISDDITVDALPIVTLTLDTASGCINKTAVTLSGGSPVGGVYSGTGVIAEKYNPSSTTAGAHTVTYTYTDPSTGCVNSATANFTVNNLPVLALGDISTCTSITLDATVNATITAPATYSWDVAAASAVSTKTISSTGPHTLLVTDANGCSTAKAFTVTVHPSPSVSLGSDTTVCFTGKEVWNDTIANTYTTILWSTGDNDNTATLAKPDSVWVLVTNQFSCEAADTMYVGEHCDAIELCFPNIFTPNSDGYNDDFRPCGNLKEVIENGGSYNFYSENILFMHFEVYDRWGLKMFQEDQPKVPVWDGKFNGKLAANGTYFWIVRYTDSSNKNYEQSGYVTLLKEEE